uniref:ATP-binding protein n=1 Tax=Paractinoplanes polyasparticus TaxID=2856853 RepID=UPI001C85EF34|nr:BTAD domain-containing putative transcriptional regulator [Actinoplanes polyasparticus]
MTQIRQGDRFVQLAGVVGPRFLAALVAANGRPVADGELVQAIWGRKLPDNPAAALQVAASRLRQTLGPIHRFSLQRANAGYQLSLPTGATDADEFTEQVGKARQAAADGRHTAAARTYADASRLWRGDPYADLEVGDTVPGDLQIARARLVNLREAAAEEAAAARLEAGDAAGAADELDALTRSAPLREHRWSLLVQALYQAGRQADALEAVHRVRGLLAEELGVDPGPELLRTERQVRRQDPVLAQIHPVKPIRPRSAFVGRAGELSRVEKLIAAGRLTTVVGPAGIGKTRLAIEVASRHEPAWLVRLADITDNRQLYSAVATAVGLPPAVLDHRSSLLAAMRLRTGLLLLDNCEHLSDVPPFVDVLLLQGPGIRVLATSRKPLGVDGEHTLALGPLPLDDAVALLEDRIRAADPARRPAPGDRAALVGLAGALDGIPLALELAAAQTRAFSIADMAGLLDDHFSVLAAVPDGSTSPHATLREAIAWSLGLLTPPQRTLLLRLWPYEGGFPLDVAAGSHATLAELVTQSVVVADLTGEVTRYRILEPIRAYCRSIDDAPAAARAAQSAWVRALVARTDIPSDVDAMRTLTRELPNIRASIAHDLTVSPQDALRTAGGLRHFWWRAGLLDEGRAVLTSALDAAPDAPVEDRLLAETARASLEFYAGDVAQARRLIAAAIAGADGCDATVAIGEALLFQAMTEVPTGDPALALASATRARNLGRQTGTPWLETTGEVVRIAASAMSGSCGDVRPRLGVTATGAAEAGQRWSAAFGRMLLAQGMMEGGESPSEILRLLRWSLREFREAGDLVHLIAVLQNLSVVLASVGRPDQAAALRDTVHAQRLRHNILMRGTYGGVTTPETWYPAVEHKAAGALSLEQAVALVSV